MFNAAEATHEAFLCIEGEEDERTILDAKPVNFLSEIVTDYTNFGNDWSFFLSIQLFVILAIAKLRYKSKIYRTEINYTKREYLKKWIKKNKFIVIQSFEVWYFVREEDYVKFMLKWC